MWTFNLFNEDIEIPIKSLIASAGKILLIILVALIIMIIIRRLVPRIIRMRMPSLGKLGEKIPKQNEQRVKTVSGVIVRAANVIVWVLAGMMILGVLGIDTTPVLATVGVASLAIGFAAQNIIRDYIHGMFIVMEDWYREGDVATCDGTVGTVQEVTLRRTVLRDLDGRMHIIPNSKIDRVSNWGRDWSRLNLDISVGYNENLDKCISVINEVCKELKADEKWGQHMITTPEVLRVNKLGDSGIDIKILGDTKPLQQWGLMGELRKRIKDRFDVEGIEIPWPHTKVYFGNDMAQAAAAATN
jgi:small-conductance mechanosensitive channel